MEITYILIQSVWIFGFSLFIIIPAILAYEALKQYRAKQNSVKEGEQKQ